MTYYSFTCEIHVQAANVIDAERILMNNVRSKLKDEKYGIVSLNYFKPVSVDYYVAN